MILKDLLVQDYPLVFKDSVVILDGVPYYILSFKNERAECLNIGSQDYVKINFPNVKEVRIPNTGMINHRGVVGYSFRIPCRRFKHGLSKENINIHTMEDGDMPPDQFGRIREVKVVGREFTSKTLYNTYMNIYPSLEDAKDMMQDGAYMVAFDRQFAIDLHNRIIYKETYVGTLEKKNRIVFQPKYEHLSLSLPKGMK